MPDPAATDAVPRRERSGLPMVARLSAMMFVQYWSLGMWWVTVSTFIAANTEQEGERVFSAGFIGYSASAAAVGSLAAPALFGWVADRLFSAEKVLCLLHAVAAAALGWMTVAESQASFFLAMLVYFQMYGPSSTLANTIALGKLADPDHEYPAVRLFGTVGWVAAGVVLGVIVPWRLGVESVEATRLPIAIAAWSHLAMAAYSLTLPATKPQPPAAASLAGEPRLFRNRALMTFLGISMVVAVTTQAYPLSNVFLNQSGYEGAAATLTLGQMTEVACLGAMATLRKRFRLKTLFLVGVASWAARFLLLAGGAQGGPDTPAAALVLAAILLHGPAYVFVYLAGQMYVDKLAPATSRGVVQGLHSVSMNGVGHLLGAGLAGWTQTLFLTPPGVSPPPYHWTPFWLTPVLPCLAAGLLFWLIFSEQPDRPTAPPAASD